VCVSVLGGQVLLDELAVLCAEGSVEHKHLRDLAVALRETGGTTTTTVTSSQVTRCVCVCVCVCVCQYMSQQSSEKQTIRTLHQSSHKRQAPHTHTHMHTVCVLYVRASTLMKGQPSDICGRVAVLAH
jgi:hypothetical protein